MKKESQYKVPDKSNFPISKILTVLFFLCSCSHKDKAIPPPNIVIIYADDLGYGDISCQNPASKILTPHIDQLTSEGMRFTDAHSSSGICSPSRFALLTGTYHWRRQHGIVSAFGEPFFEDTDITLPQLLKTNGYTTACIGKWHLGWDWEFINEPSAEVFQWGRIRKAYLPEDIDWSKPVAGGPLARGFDYYFGDGTINFPPYTWVENDKILEAPDTLLDINNIGYETKEGNWEFRPGPVVKGWDPYEVLPTITQKAVEWIQSQSKAQPFFLYFPLTAPHAPIIPNDEFDQTSQAGAYGDFVVQVDDIVGQVLSALKEKGLEENTLVIFSSDNGPERYAFERGENYDHFSMGEYRGLKRDVWEGGHHVPFIVKWPGQIEMGAVSDEVLSQVDVMSTLATFTGIPLPEQAAPDSYDFTPVMTGESYSSPLREATVHNTYENIWGLRQGKWLYINHNTGEHSKMPDSFKALRNYEDFETEGLLFDMEKDPGQRNNVYEDYPDRVAVMDKLLDEYRNSSSSNKNSQ